MNIQADIEKACRERAKREWTEVGHVETWRAIAYVLGRSERWCRYMSVRDPDRLPVFKIGGIVRLNVADWEEWVTRQQRRPIDVARAISGAV